MRVHVVDPSAYTPPYDHALSAALAGAGAEVDLFTSPFAYGSVAAPDGYERRETFYRLAARARSARARRAIKLAEHVPDMLAYRRAATAAEIVHFQWLTVQHVDGLLLPRGRPLVLTAHDILPREARPGQRSAQRRLFRRFDAVVVHSDAGARRLTDEIGLAPELVHVIPHGALAHLAGGEDEDPGRDAPFQSDGPVVLMFGLVRPYKGLDVLLDAWGEGLDGAELWVVGMPRMDISKLREGAPASVRFLPRYVAEDELAALFRRADIVVLPYREIDQSGVLFTALAFGKPLVLSDVGGFPEVARTGAARCFASGDAAKLRGTLSELLGDPAARERMAASARAAAAGPYSWDALARQTLALYEELLAR